MPTMATQTRAVRLPPPLTPVSDSSEGEEEVEEEVAERSVWREGVVARLWRVRWVLVWDLVQVVCGVLAIWLILRFDLFSPPK